MTMHVRSVEYIADSILVKPKIVSAVCSLPVRVATQHIPIGSSLLRASVQCESSPRLSRKFRVKFDTARRSAQSCLRGIWAYTACPALLPVAAAALANSKMK